MKEVCKNVLCRTACLLMLATGPQSIAWSATVELNVVPSSRAPFSALQEWTQSLGKLKSVRVRASSRGSTTPDIQRGSDIVRVNGVIDSGNQLVVPGKRFSVRQIAALQSWLDQQAAGETATSKTSSGKNRFGLTKEQVESVHRSLKAIVFDSTKGKPAQHSISAIAKRAGLPIRFGSGLQTILADATVTDEWQGFTGGTAIAAILRPMELVFVPRVTGGRMEMLVTTDDAVAEGWPVGWKSQLKKSQLIPKIYDPLPIDVVETPIADVMSAISQRIETPMFYDTALLDLLKIDPATTNVTYSKERTIYTKAISLMLGKAQLKHEVRVDEVGKPFIWIMPRRVPK